jgi:hypothetical protein
VNTKYCSRVLSGLAVASVIIAGELAAEAATPHQATPTPPPVSCPPCPTPPTLRTALQAADVTFVGTVVTSTVNVDREWRHEVRFQVEATWTTGVVGDTAVVNVPHAVWECGKQPEAGQRWLLFAMLDNEGHLAIDQCDRSHAVVADDPDLSELGTGCDPVRSMTVVLSPGVVHVGEAFSVTLQKRSLALMEFSLTTDPPGAARLQPPCPPPCHDWSVLKNVLAVKAGNVWVHISAFGEAMECYKGGPVWSWAHPAEGAFLVVLPNGAPYRIWLPSALSRSRASVASRESPDGNRMQQPP